MSRLTILPVGPFGFGVGGAELVRLINVRPDGGMWEGGRPTLWQ